MARVRWLAALCLLPATVAAQPPQQHPQWAQLPRMQLERQLKARSLAACSRRATPPAGT
jgi:hypothetical protein